MTWHKLTFSVTVSTEEELGAMEDMSEMICDVVEAILNGVPETTVETFDKVAYEISAPGEDDGVSFTTAVSEYGNSLAVNITKQANRMNIRKGDKVLVTVAKIGGDEKQ